ncbi:PhnE/PtxC family ABC transporter permease [Nesterenkonia alba]|uniref:PhnE/PtxC family ABC transporter permease n=1 Tax=Nesterenkonia alba TaxID=515814 RepID=UPI0003B30BB4|nr:ABC transporter permease subunit [Nesterenkonia alba]
MTTLTRERADTRAVPAGGGARPQLTDRRTLRPPSARALLGLAIMGSFVAGGIWSLIELRVNIASLIVGYENAVNFFTNRVGALQLPPLGELAQMTVMTLAIVICATALGMVLSLILGLLAATNTCRHAPVRAVARVIVIVMRAVPELIMAIIFIRVFGFGAAAVAGILALGLNSIGMLGKFYTEAIEDHDDGPRQALETGGSVRLQQIFGATLPGIMPAVVAHGLHRFDINLRASVILGYVGLPGLGMELSSALGVGNYSLGIGLALVILGICIAAELLSGFLRMKLLGRSEPSRFGFFWLVGKMRRRYDANRLEAPSGARPAAWGERTTPPWNGERTSRFTYIGLFGLVILASVWLADIDWIAFFHGLLSIPAVAGQFIPPSDGGIAERLWTTLLETIQMGLAATFLGALLALPVGVLAARNVAPNRAVVQFFRTLIVVTRGVPELILAIILIVIMGMGAVAGVLALAVGAMGLLSKLVADSIEETDIRVQQAIATGGAARTQVFFASTVRQAAPAIVAHLFYQLDVNIRAATLLGIVGAGGVGYYLLNANRVLQFEVVTYICLMIVGVILLLEFITSVMRRLLR